ncbi:MAG: hypothetical protein ACLTDV_07530 [Eubacterium sp.]
MKTVGVGAVKPESDNADELKKEIKGLKSSNTKLKNKIEELEEKMKHCMKKTNLFVQKMQH